jgi:hypothetical protein
MGIKNMTILLLLLANGDRTGRTDQNPVNQERVDILKIDRRKNMPIGEG